jgi:hypothetical protein
MRETVKSLKIYFGLCGIYALVDGIESLLKGQFAVGVLVILIGAAYSYLAARLPQLLDERLGTVKWVLTAASTVQGLGLVSGLVFGNRSVAVVCVLGLLINWYLFRNARRLSKDRRHQADGTIPTSIALEGVTRQLTPTVRPDCIPLLNEQRTRIRDLLEWLRLGRDAQPTLKEMEPLWRGLFWRWLLLGALGYVFLVFLAGLLMLLFLPMGIAVALAGIFALPFLTIPFALNQILGKSFGKLIFHVEPESSGRVRQLWTVGWRFVVRSVCWGFAFFFGWFLLTFLILFPIFFLTGESSGVFVGLGYLLGALMIIIAPTGLLVGSIIELRRLSGEEFGGFKACISAARSDA